MSSCPYLSISVCLHICMSSCLHVSMYYMYCSVLECNALSCNQCKNVCRIASKIDMHIIYTYIIIQGMILSIYTERFGAFSPLSLSLSLTLSHCLIQSLKMSVVSSGKCAGRMFKIAELIQVYPSVSKLLIRVSIHCQIRRCDR